MQFYILHKDPVKSALLVPEQYKFKMLLELAQMVSTLTGIGYKPIVQGKELVKWIDKHRWYTYVYFETLLKWSSQNIKMKEKTISDLKLILRALHFDDSISPKEAYFRYAKEYSCKMPSKSLLSIEKCIEEYHKYLKWKCK